MPYSNRVNPEKGTYEEVAPYMVQQAWVKAVSISLVMSMRSAHSTATPMAGSPRQSGTRTSTGLSPRTSQQWALDAVVTALRDTPMRVLRRPSDSGSMNAAAALKSKASRVPFGGMVYTVVVTVIAIVLICAGIVMLVIPGPGILTILLGFTLLGTEFPWAKRLVHRIRALAQPYIDRVLVWWRSRQ